MSSAAKEILFICYSHTDQSYKQRFDKFLKGGSLHEKMEIFSDADIAPGEEWQAKIVQCLRKATAALLLVSQDFMISPFIQQVELRELLTAQVRRGLRLFLVPVRSTYHEGTYLERFQWARPPNKPLSALTEAEQEQAMVDVCRKIADQLTAAADEKTTEHTIRCLESIPKLDLPEIYELEGRVGDGHFSHCYLARDRLLDRNVVVKVLKAELSRDSPAYDRYVRSSSKLKHRNILGVLFSQANKLPHFIVTPNIDGPTLKERLSEEGGQHLSYNEAVIHTLQLARTLAYAHDHGCVHGRLRPSEIRFDGEGQPMLSGFRTVPGAAAGPAQPGALAMSLEDFVYASPEGRRGEMLTEQSDQYLLGLVAYEMISGGPPVSVPSWGALLEREVARSLVGPRALKDFVDQCAAAVSDVVMRMLAFDPMQRWQNLHEVVKRLEDARSGTYCFQVAKDSYRRCAQNAKFYQSLYDRLFQALPEVQAMFKRASLPRQYELLRQSLWLLLQFPETRERGEPTILSGIARTHAHFQPEQFDKFRAAIIDTVAEHDGGEPAVLQAWHMTLAPGFDYLKSKLSAAAAEPDSRAPEGKPAVRSERRRQLLGHRP
jgi:serine/threonine protein kinase